MQYEYTMIVEDYHRRPIALDRCSADSGGKSNSVRYGDSKVPAGGFGAARKKTFADFRRVIPPLFIAAAALSEFLSRITGRGANPPPPPLPTES